MAKRWGDKFVQIKLNHHNEMMVFTRKATVVCQPNGNLIWTGPNLKVTTTEGHEFVVVTRMDVNKKVCLEAIGDDVTDLEEVYESLCTKDPRNPYYQNLYGYDEPEERPVPRDNCFCDSCYIGKDKLAMMILKLLG